MKPLRKKTRSNKSDTDDASSCTSCKYCNTPLKPAHVVTQSKKQLPAQYGVYWGGLEKPAIHIAKVSCPNLGCQKTYTVRLRISQWEYK